MGRPQPRPSLAKAPTKEHPLAPATTATATATTASSPQQGQDAAGPRAEASAAAQRQDPAAPEDPTTSSRPRRGTSEGKDSERAMFATRLDPQLRQRLKIHAAQRGLTIQEIAEAAFRSYLDHQDHR